MHFRQLLVIVLSVAFGKPISAQTIFPDMQGQALLDQLVQAYKPASVLTYGQARDTLYGLIYNQNDSVQCVYSGHRLYLPPGEDPTSWLFMSGTNDGINCEHTWPQSKGAATGNPESDMHHLFPTRSAVNAARDNFPFNEIPDVQTTQWYYLDQVQTYMPVQEIELYSERVNGTFEPREDHKGNVARAMFYFYTMYQQEADAADPNYFQLQRQVLCEWHYLDPADSLETRRSWQIANYQDGKPNPYVVDCTLLSRSFCSDTPGECPTPISSTQDGNVQHEKSESLLIAPNPITSNAVAIHATEPGRLTVLDSLGRKLMEVQWSPGQPLEIGSLPLGHYFIALDKKSGMATGQFIKE
ncbi:MAG: endonuclease [Saprospiraceae bacterium]|nr:endonuclease [Saprospiraceae bacterium]